MQIENENKDIRKKTKAADLYVSCYDLISHSWLSWLFDFGCICFLSKLHESTYCLNGVLFTFDFFPFVMFLFVGNLILQNTDTNFKTHCICEDFISKKIRFNQRQKKNN